MLKFLIFSCLFLSLFSPVSSQIQAGFIALGTGQDNNWDFKIKCFPFSSFKILYLSAANINTDGSVALRFANDGLHIPQAVSKAHSAGAKILLSVGGPAGYPSFSFANAVKNPVAFVKSLVGYRNQFGLDGFDLDWEENPEDADIQVLSRAFRSESGLSGSLLTLDVYSGSGLSSQTLGGFDYINVMNYGAGISLAYDDIGSAAGYFRGRVAAERLIIGVNFEAYGDDSSERTEVTSQLRSVVATWDKESATGVFSWNSFDDSGASNQGCVWSGTNEISKKLQSSSLFLE